MMLRILALAIAVLIAPAAQALEGKLVHLKVETANVPGPVDVAVYIPAGYDAKRAETYPLIVQLHGGGGSSANMTAMAETLEDGRLIVLDAQRHTGYGANDCVTDAVNDFLVTTKVSFREKSC